MSIAVTYGSLSYLDNSTKKSIMIEWQQIGSILRQLPFDYDILNDNIERQEILLKFENPATFNPEDIREVLKRLQQLTQQSFVALINMVSQCILITIRG